MAITDNISSEYIKSQNALHKRKGKIISVFVENEDDIPFWKNIFNKFKLQTKINPASKTSLTRGKQEVLKFKDGAGEFLLLCVDSDYDYLSDGATETSKIIKENPFIFQTYTYSVENYKCFSDSLHQIVVSATLNDNPIFDYKAFIEKYSEITYDLFLYSFFYERKYQQETELHQQEYKVRAQSLDQKSLGKWQNDNQPKQVFPIVEDFCSCIKILNQVDISDQGKQALAALEEEVNKKLASLPQIDENSLENLKKELSKLGLSPKNTYFFIQGHTIYDNVVLMFLKPVYQRLKKEKFEEFKHNARTEEEKENKINYYKKAIMADIESILRNHTNYQDCFLMSKIESDIKNYILLYPIS
ncbi:MAG: hypothetical protein BWK80_43205 [Desulfobacteraceae bacterium IS3]|nr:MAG: hypothetical protein BWK80_43205 [Desulfobacteraceae bacterium IS3]HAO21260.1 hypothetical protein [Desulfobacteraceae bacterium]